MNSQNPSDKNSGTGMSSQEKSPSLEAYTSIALFEKDKTFYFAHQKVGKLVAAVYLLTNFFPDEEPMKWSLRSLGSSLPRLVMEAWNRRSSNPKQIESAIREDIFEIISLLDVASLTGLVSEMNITILKREFNEFLNHIHSVLNQTKENAPFNKSGFFDVPELPKIQEDKNDKDAEVFEGEFKDNKTAYAGVKDRKVSDYSKEKNVAEEQPRSNPFTQGQSKEKLKNFSPVLVKKNKRQSIIINLLKRKKEIMVKDVAEIIHDCSEKTIQRELSELVEKGVLSKEGERRWTKYRLA